MARKLHLAALENESLQFKADSIFFGHTFILHSFALFKLQHDDVDAFNGSADSGLTLASQEDFSCKEADRKCQTFHCLSQSASDGISQVS